MTVAPTRTPPSSGRVDRLPASTSAAPTPATRTSERSPSNTDCVTSLVHAIEIHTQAAKHAIAARKHSSILRSWTAGRSSNATPAAQQNASELQPHDTGKKPPFAEASPATATAAPIGSESRSTVAPREAAGRRPAAAAREKG